MSQEQFDVICKILQNGAPALSIELINAITNVLTVNEKLYRENEELKKKFNPEKCEQNDKEEDK